MSPFYLWLEQQRQRQDMIGAYARKATVSTAYPRLSSKLSVLLKFEPDKSRAVLKQAHREWRRTRREKVA